MSALGTQVQQLCDVLVRHRTFVGVSLLIRAHSLATRGADFGDGSVYITYRNVSFDPHMLS